MDYANLTDEQLEMRLLELGFDESSGGRAIEARKSALRTVLARREGRRAATDVDTVIAKATAIVNDVRAPGWRISVDEMDEYWAASIVGDPGWAELFVTPEESEEVDRRRRAGTWHAGLSAGGPEEPHAVTGCPFCAEAR